MKKLLFLSLFIFTTVIFAQNVGIPQNLINCDDVPSNCFNLSSNTPNILGSLNPADYTVTYHFSANDATSGSNPILNTVNYCMLQGNSMAIYTRRTKNSDLTYQTQLFYIEIQTYQNKPARPQMVRCDDDNDGLINFDLTMSLTTSTSTLSYYTTLASAQTMTNPIANPSAWTVNGPATMTESTVYIREVVVGGCDFIYALPLQALSNCTISTACNTAESLCSSLGQPFPNTTSVVSTGPVSCLGSNPNPKWFYFSISSPGTVKVRMVQVNNNGGSGIDVDYILYGPFSNPLTPCSNPSQMLSMISSCSYSTAAIETAVVPNAQPGQHYILMITNFSNQAGMITVTQSNLTEAGHGLINCSGLMLNAFLDNNTNGIKDNGEMNFPLGEFHYEKNNNGIVHNITAPTGIYDFYDNNPANTYDVSFSVDTSYTGMYAVSPSSYSNLSVPLNSGLTVYNFPVTILQGYTDLAVSVVPLNAPRPGFTYKNKIVYTNFGTQNIPNGTLTFTNDSNITIASISQTGTNPTASGFTYDFINLAPFESRDMMITMNVPPIPAVNAGDNLTNSVSIVPLVGDSFLSNNSGSCTSIVVNAYDPNDKMEAHGERILHSSFSSNDYLYYTIRFENTGTASAWNVSITDMLDMNLDENSIRMVNASHPYEMDRVGNSITWNFDSIQLPVSVPNTDIGKGYITFKIKPNPGYAVGDIITNAASIYFDFNPPIVTNVFSTEFVATLGTTQFENGDFILYPNPTFNLVTVSLADTQNAITSIVVYDVLGKTILTEKVSDVATQTIDVSSLNSGMYFIEVTTNTNVKVLKKLMVN